MASLPFLNALVGRRTFMKVIAQVLYNVVNAVQQGDEPDPVEVIDVYGGPDMSWLDVEIDPLPVAVYAGPPMEDLPGPVGDAKAPQGSAYPGNFSW